MFDMSRQIREKECERSVRLWPFFVFPPTLLLGLCWLLSALYYREAKKDFEACRAELAAIGESLNIEDLRPEVLDPERNVAAAPIFAELLAELRADPHLDFKEHPVFGALREEAIQGYVSPTLQLPEKRTETVTLLRGLALHEYYPDHGEMEAARAILDHGLVHRESLAEIAAAVRRPEANFGIRYEDGFAASLHHLNLILELGKFLKAHSRASLVVGDPATAAADVSTLLQLSDHLRAEPSLISCLFSISTYELALSVIHEGLASSTWREADEVVLAAELSDPEWWPAFADSLRMERATFVDFCQQTIAGDRKQENVTVTTWAPYLFKAFPLLQKAWLCDSAANYSRLMQEQISLVAANESGQWDTPAWERLKGTLEEMSEHPLRKIRFHLVTSIPASFAIHRRPARSHTHGNLARLALALAQVRRSTGAYPAKLEECFPFLAGDVPRDLFTGQSLIYRPLPDDDYLLYSVGENGLDDGGLLKKRPEHGDWVWRLRRPADFDHDAYRAP